MSERFPNFLGLSDAEALYENSPDAILPVCFEKTTSFMRGTCLGPKAILDASLQLEFYDMELGQETWKPGLHTLPPMFFEKESSEEAVKMIEKQVAVILGDGKCPLLLGGEHTVSAGAIKAAVKRHPGLSVLQIDAHADLYPAYQGSPYSHACAMRLIAGDVKSLVGVGIRSLCRDEVAFASENRHIHLVRDHERVKNPRWIDEVLEKLTDTVYVTVDVDGFDPSLIPATGTPEPGGLSWYEGMELLRRVFREKKVVGADVVELMPVAGEHASNFICAKLVYKLIGYRRFAK